MLCSCDIAANSFNHSSNKTAHSAKSRVRLLLPIITAAFVDELDIASIEEYVELSFDRESYDNGPDDGDASRTVAFDEPENYCHGNLLYRIWSIEWRNFHFSSIFLVFVFRSKKSELHYDYMLTEGWNCFKEKTIICFEGSISTIIPSIDFESKL